MSNSAAAWRASSFPPNARSASAVASAMRPSESARRASFSSLSAVLVIEDVRRS